MAITDADNDVTSFKGRKLGLVTALTNSVYVPGITSQKRLLMVVLAFERGSLVATRFHTEMLGVFSMYAYSSACDEAHPKQ